jgi:hypothetical protein
MRRLDALECDHKEQAIEIKEMLVALRLQGEAIQVMQKAMEVGHTDAQFRLNWKTTVWIAAIMFGANVVPKGFDLIAAHFKW